MDSHKSGEGALLPGLCDFCGATISHGSELYALVPDSSAINARDPELDGKRFLTACSRDHLAELQEKYLRKPYVIEELWTGKISRAIQDHPFGLSLKQLAEVTGLSVPQIERAEAWQNQRKRRELAGD
jgi:hypothetical protein